MKHLIRTALAATIAVGALAYASPTGAATVPPGVNLQSLNRPFLVAHPVTAGTVTPSEPFNVANTAGEAPRSPSTALNASQASDGPDPTAQTVSHP